MTEYVHPSQLTDEQRRANSAALQDRMANAMSRVAVSGKTKTAREANARDARTARTMATKLRAS